MKRDSEYDLLQRIPPELEAIHLRLENWARWSRDKRVQGHCRSIEYRYKSSEVWDQSEPRMEPAVLDALAIYRAVLQLPNLHRRLLQSWYVKRTHVMVIRRKLGLTRDGVVTELNKARRMVENVR